MLRSSSFARRHALAYESRYLNEQEHVLGIYEKELLAVIHALDSWKHYLLGNPFIIRTDHQRIKYFMSQTKLSDKQMRWANFLSQFHFHIAHIPGKHNTVVLMLSHDDQEQMLFRLHTTIIYRVR